MLHYVFREKMEEMGEEIKNPMSFDRNHMSYSHVFIRKLWCTVCLQDSLGGLQTRKTKKQKCMLDGNRAFPPHPCFCFERFLPKTPSTMLTSLGCWVFWLSVHILNAFLNGYSYFWRLKWLKAFSWEECECHSHKTAQEVAPLSPIICLIKAKNANTEGKKIKAWHVKANLRMTAVNPGLI